jgi:hypothetical protein
VAATPLTAKGPGQPGTSALDIVVPSRIVNAQVYLLGTDLANLWTLRAAVSSAMAQEPVPSGGTLALGLLTFKRGGAAADLEIPAIPNSVALLMPATAGTGKMAADLEWLCPYPFWRATLDTTVTIATASTPTAVANTGDALTPPVIRIYGDLTLVTVTNLTTGQAFQIGGQIASGDYVEINTTPGQKSVMYWTGGVGTNYLSNLNVAIDDLFQLAVGANSCQFVASATGGSGARDVVFTYRPKARGV